VLTKDQVETLRRSRKGGRNRLARAMELAHVTQVQLAEKTGYTQPYISKVKNGQYADLPGETMRTFAEVFGCSIEDLFPAREAVAS
jgi:transcriptional regulator with XRE-family HTH domain